MSAASPFGQLAKVEEIFAAALEIGEGEARRAFVAARTAGEPELGHEILSLLAADAAGAALFGEDVPGDLRGERLGPYRVGEEIGRGGMATVYLGQRVDGELERTVAIKVLRRASAEQRARFLFERQTLVALRHPFIVAPLDAGTTADGRPYLVLEKVDGRALLRYCEEEALDLEARLELFEKICQAVDYAHRRLVIHRDLKPSNILVDQEGQPRLLDFGIAKLLGAPPPAAPEPAASQPAADAAGGESRDAGSDLTGAEGAPFTPRYASPEQIRGEPVSTATDVYSLGVLLGELLAGLPAADGQEPPSAALRRRPDLDPAERERRARRVDGDLDAIAAKARAADPAARYLSAEALREEFVRRRARLPLAAREPRRAYLAALFLRRHRWRLAAAALVAIVLLAAAAVSRRAEQRALASEAIAWRAHAEAAWVSQTLARLLADLASGGDGQNDAVAALAETERLLAKADGKAPEAEARLRHALALVYARVGRREEALGHARRAADLARGTRGLGAEDLEANLRLLRELEAAGPEPEQP